MVEKPIEKQESASRVTTLVEVEPAPEVTTLVEEFVENASEVIPSEVTVLEDALEESSKLTPGDKSPEQHE